MTSFRDQDDKFRRDCEHCRTNRAKFRVTLLDGNKRLLCDRCRDEVIAKAKEQRRKDKAANRTQSLSQSSAQEAFNNVHEDSTKNSLLRLSSAKDRETAKIVLQNILETDKTGLQGKVHLQLCLIEAEMQNNAKALKFLRQALENGFKDFNEIFSASSLKSIRTQPAFSSLIERYSAAPSTAAVTTSFASPAPSSSSSSSTTSSSAATNNDILAQRSSSSNRQQNAVPPINGDICFGSDVVAKRHQPDVTAAQAYLQELLDVSKTHEVLQSQGFLLDREFVSYNSPLAAICVAVASRLQPTLVQHYVAYLSLDRRLQFKGVAGQFETVHDFLASSLDCFVDTDESRLGLWAPSQRALLRAHPQLGDERVLPAGESSGAAAARLVANPALTFVLCERPSDRKTLTLVSLRSQRPIKSLIVRESTGFAITKDRESVVRRATLLDLLVAVFGSAVVPTASPLSLSSTAASSTTRSARLAHGGSTLLIAPSSPSLALARDSSAATTVLSRATSTSMTTSMQRQPSNGAASWIQRQPSFATLRAIVASNNTDNSESSLSSLSSSSSMASVSSSSDSAKTSSSDSAKTPSWRCFVRRTKLYDLNPSHRDLDGAPLSEHAWYHFAISDSDAASLLDLYA